MSDDQDSCLRNVKWAATGSGEPRACDWFTPTVQRLAAIAMKASSDNTGRDPLERFGCVVSAILEAVPTPPASQPTVTLDRETLDKIIAELIEANYWSSPRARDHIRNALTLLRAAEQKGPGRDEQ